VLIAFIAAITGKVLHAQRHRPVAGALADTIAIGLGVGNHGLMVGAEGAGGNHGVAPVGEWMSTIGVKDPQIQFWDLAAIDRAITRPCSGSLRLQDCSLINQRLASQYEGRPP
jgi:hypothetical protein